jgi:PhnB protein
MKKGKKVAPIPEDRPGVSLFLSIRGAAGAIDFYKKAFGMKERFRILGPDGGIAQAHLELAGTLIIVADEVRDAEPDEVTSSGSASYIVYVKDADAAFKKAVELGAESAQNPRDTLWGDRTAAIVDPFGYVWSFSTRIEDVSPEEFAKRAAELMGMESPEN